MKYVYALFGLFVTVNLLGQTNYKPAEDMIRSVARYWSDPSNSAKWNTRGALTALTHKLDSVVTKEENGVVSFRSEMDYNELGHTTEMRQYAIDSNTFTLTLNNVFTFDYAGTPGYPTRILSETYNPQTQQFEADLEMNIIYDGSNRVDSIVISIEDPLFGGGFGPFIAVKQVYSGDLLVQSRQWINIILFGGWVPSSFTDYYYDLSDFLTEQISSILDFSTGEIVPDTRTTFEYNAQGQEQNVTQYVWNDPVWEPTLQNYFEYFPNGVLNIETVLTYNINISDWENNSRTVYPVQTVDFEFPSTSYFWDPIASAWVETDSTISLLNPALPWEQVAAPTQLAILSTLGGDLDGGLFNAEGSSITETRYFLVDSLTGEFYLDYTDIYHYSLIEGSAVNPVLPEFLAVTPNPAQDQFTINLDSDLRGTYTVYTQTGARITNGDLAAGRTGVQTGGWATGLYFVIIRLEDGNTYVHKQMVE